MNINEARLLLEKYESDISRLYIELRSNAIINKIKESSGVEEILNNVEDFNGIYTQIFEKLHEMQELSSKIQKVNNTIECIPGITIQSALSTLKNLRYLQSILKEIQMNKKSKTRKADQNGQAYYYIQELNFSPEWLKQQIEELEQKINMYEAAVLRANTETQI